MEKNYKLAQSGDQMFERNLAIIANRQQEVRVFSDTFVYEGYICGLDEQWMQIYGHEENDKDNATTMWRFLLIARNNISAIGPTGQTLDDVDQGTADWISKKIHTFSIDVAGKLVKVRSKNDGKREDV
jgi:hypothetical protein